MGGCPYMGIKDGSPECETYKYDIDRHIKKYLSQYEQKATKK
jgi:hypothetical protein